MSEKFAKGSKDTRYVMEDGPAEDATAYLGPDVAALVKKGLRMDAVPAEGSHPDYFKGEDFCLENTSRRINTQKGK